MTSNQFLPFQMRVKPWLLACFGQEIADDISERNHRFLEEALELVQSTGCTQSEAHQLVDYVFNRPVGEVHQEVGGVMVTLAALCLATNEDMHQQGENELRRIWTKVDEIREKQANKPKHSPLPQAQNTLDIDQACIREFENDIKDMLLDEINQEIKRAEDVINEEEPWLEALHAQKRQMEAQAND